MHLGCLQVGLRTVCLGLTKSHDLLNEFSLQRIGEFKKGKIRNHLYSKGELVNTDEVPKMKTIIHGSGCALSTSILCFLVNKKSLKDACSKSQNFMKVLVKNSRNHIHQNILKI